MKKIVRLTESDLVRLVKRVIKEQGGPNPTNPKLNLSPNVKKILWNKISSSPELKQHLDIMPHHTEHNFLEDIKHEKVHIHLDPKSEHVEIQFPGLGKHHNINLNVGGSYNTHHYSSHGESSWKQPVVNVGVSTNFGGGHKKPQLKQW
jgi:hypothetical protein